MSTNPFKNTISRSTTSPTPEDALNGTETHFVSSKEHTRLHRQAWIEILPLPNIQILPDTPEAIALRILISCGFTPFMPGVSISNSLLKIGDQPIHQDRAEDKIFKDRNLTVRAVAWHKATLQPVYALGEPGTFKIVIVKQDSLRQPAHRHGDYIKDHDEETGTEFKGVVIGIGRRVYTPREYAYILGPKTLDNSRRSSLWVTPSQTPQQNASSCEP